MTEKVTKTAKVKKKKVSIADLQVKPKRLTLVHPDPELDVGGAWVEIIPAESSLDYVLTAMKLHNMDLDSLSVKDSLEYQCEMIASLIKDWDVESFGTEFSLEAIMQLFQNPSNFWIRDQIQAAIAADSNFFH